MSRKYKFHNREGLYFVSFATVYWLDVFVRDIYFNEMLKSLEYSRVEKGLELYAYCIMPSHVHLIFRAKHNNPSSLLGDIQ
jgi:REP element-mobilizing transposase RayT